MTWTEHVEPLIARRWRSDQLDSIEDFRLDTVSGGFRLSGVTDIAFADRRIELAYEVTTDREWRTLTARIDTADLVIDVDVEGVSWNVNGMRRRDLEGCVDIDLGWTPATNTLPIRRLGDEGEASLTTRAAWLRWPELSFSRVDQTYDRAEPGRWTYRRGDFSAPLEVDSRGVVVSYGIPAIWYAV